MTMAMKKTAFILGMAISAVYSGILEHGRNEIGGGLSFAYYDGQAGGNNMAYAFAPYYNRYLTDHISIGPIISVAGSSRTFALEVGMCIGYAVSYRNTYPYLSVGYECGKIFGRHANQYAMGFPLTAGIKVLFQQHVGINPHIVIVPVREQDISEHESYINAGIAIAVFGLL